MSWLKLHKEEFITCVKEKGNSRFRSVQSLSNVVQIIIFSMVYAGWHKTLAINEEPFLDIYEPFLIINCKTEEPFLIKVTVHNHPRNLPVFSIVC